MTFIFTYRWAVICPLVIITFAIFMITYIMVIRRLAITKGHIKPISLLYLLGWLINIWWVTFGIGSVDCLLVNAMNQGPHLAGAAHVVLVIVKVPLGVCMYTWALIHTNAIHIIF